MQIAAIERQSTADLVVERIAQVIRHRGLLAGDRLPGEHELVEQLKVSRPVLREALPPAAASPVENVARRLTWRWQSKLDVGMIPERARVKRRRALDQVVLARRSVEPSAKDLARNSAGGLLVL